MSCEDRGVKMPIASPEIYSQMLDRAKSGAFAYPAINVSSSQTLIAALRGFAEAKSDGIIQFSWGGAEYASGSTVKHMVDGAVALAEFAHNVAKNYPVNIALHTDHCPAEKLDGFMRPLLDFGIERIKAGKAPLFQSHMWDGSAVSLSENMKIANEMLDKSVAAKTILELEIGVVGGEEDGIEAKHDAKLYSHPEDALLTVETLGLGERGRYLLAATFGNVHGVYKPGNVVLQPKILKTLQDAVVAKKGLAAGSKPFDLVFHGGSGSLLSEIREALDYGVVKMNIDTDTQYAFTRPVVDHVMKNYDGVLRIDGEVGNKKMYDPRAWGKQAEAGMAARVVRACEDLRSTGTSLIA
jgi:fructose-bisphosphate aldolase class II